MTIPKFADTDVKVRSEGDFFLSLQGQSPWCGSLDWFREHRQALVTALDTYGAIVFRDFQTDTKQFQDALDLLVPEHYDMIDIVTPRAHVRDKLYTSTQAPPSMRIPQHEEMPYRMFPPWYLGFYCEVPSEGDGFTPVHDLRRLGRRIREKFPAVLDRFIELGVRYIRNFNQYSYKTWQTCWECTTREELEPKLRVDDIEWEWLPNDALRVFQRRPAVLRDPISKSEILYPSLGIFHRSFVKHITEGTGVPLAPTEAEQSLNCSFGDGSPIPEDFSAWVREQAEATCLWQPWRSGDFLLINNLISGHGRTAYSNPKRSVVASFRGKLDLNRFQVTA